jgi:hypothetical protein
MTLLYATTRSAAGDGRLAPHTGEKRSRTTSCASALPPLRAYDEKAGTRLPSCTRTGRCRSPRITRGMAHLERLVEQGRFHPPNADLDVVWLRDAKDSSPGSTRRCRQAGTRTSLRVTCNGNNCGVYSTATPGLHEYRQSTLRDSSSSPCMARRRYLPQLWSRTLAPPAAACPPFARFIELLARHTRARAHHTSSLSAGGARIVSSALSSLGAARPAPGDKGLRERLRPERLYVLNSADIEIREFVSDLAQYADLPLRITTAIEPPRLRPCFCLAPLPGTSRAGQAQYG